MKCKDPNLVSDIHPYDKETFGIRCGNVKEQPSFETPPPPKWPRCFPKVCVPYLEKHQVGSTFFQKKTKNVLPTFFCC